MKLKHYLVTSAVCLILLASGQAHSDDPKFSLALFGGITNESINVPTPPGVTLSVDWTEAFGLGIAYRFTDSVGIELQYVKGGFDLDASGPRGTIENETTIETSAIYLTQRSTGDLFVKTKIGLIQEELSSSPTDASTPTIASVSEVGLSYGIGFGYKLSNNLSIEAEYVKVEQDISWFLLSGRFSFGR